MNYAASQFWFDVVTFILISVIGVYLFINTRQQVTANKLEEHERSQNTRFGELEQRIARVESSCETSPKHGDIAGVAQKVEKLDGKLEALIASVDRITDHLMNKG